VLVRFALSGQLPMMQQLLLLQGAGLKKFVVEQWAVHRADIPLSPN
jgi:hypothetical protein